MSKDGATCALTKDEVALASDAWEAFIRAHNVMQRAMQADEAFQKVTIREYDVLYSLAKAGRPLTQAELLKAAALSQPAVSRMLTRMVNRGLIKRESCVEDGRSTVLSLTEEGAKTQREVGRVHGNNIARYVWGALDGDQIEQLRVLCTRLQKP